MNGKPWFKFYPEKWLSDSGVSELSLAAQGIYLRMLSCCWSEGGIEFGETWPKRVRDLPERYRRVFGVASEGNLSRVWGKFESSLSRHFVKQSDGKWWNRRLLMEFSTFATTNVDESRVDETREEHTHTREGDVERTFVRPSVTDDEEPTGLPPGVTKADVDALVGSVAKSFPSSPVEACEVQARSGSVVLRLCGYNFSSRRAREIIQEHGHTDEDMDAWDRWAREKDRPAVLAAIQSHRNPNQIQNPRKDTPCQPQRELTIEELRERQAQARENLKRLGISRDGAQSTPAQKALNAS